MCFENGAGRQREEAEGTDFGMILITARRYKLVGTVGGKEDRIQDLDKAKWI